MITFEQFATWMSVFITLGSAILLTAAYFVARHYRQHDRRVCDELAKEGLLRAERKQSRRAQAHSPRGGA